MLIYVFNLMLWLKLQTWEIQSTSWSAWSAGDLGSNPGWGVWNLPKKTLFPSGCALCTRICACCPRSTGVNCSQSWITYCHTGDTGSNPVSCEQPCACHPQRMLHTIIQLLADLPYHSHPSVCLGTCSSLAPPKYKCTSWPCPNYQVLRFCTLA